MTDNAFITLEKSILIQIHVVLTHWALDHIKMWSDTIIID